MVAWVLCSILSRPTAHIFVPRICTVEMALRRSRRRVDCVIESSLHEILVSKNLALINLSWNFYRCDNEGKKSLHKIWLQSINFQKFPSINHSCDQSQTCVLEAACPVKNYMRGIAVFFGVILLKAAEVSTLWAWQGRGMGGDSCFWTIYTYAHINICIRTICTIGRTSRATFGIPAKCLNITIYPIPGDSLF